MTCPKCNKELKERQGKYGQFWGCTGYPHCTYTFTETKGGYSRPEPHQKPQNTPPSVQSIQNDINYLKSISEALKAINSKLDIIASNQMAKFEGEEEMTHIKDIPFR